MKLISKLLEFRQAALKLFMNVTYGQFSLANLQLIRYTGASFSGRMPCGDIADSVVETAKQTLMKSIDYITKNEKWKASVVYGDTDSIFVHLKGRSIQQAFEIGKEMAKEVTQLFPHPIELKFEKLFKSSILCAKKRYVGYKCDPISEKGILDAKGIEIVRRDGCEELTKIMQKCVSEIFETKNLSNVKSYLQKQWARIQNGLVNYKDFIIEKEVKLGTYKVEPASALAALDLINRDPMLFPKFQERIKYLVVQCIEIYSSQKSKLKDLVVSVPNFLENFNHQLN